MNLTLPALIEYFFIHFEDWGTHANCKINLTTLAQCRGGQFLLLRYYVTNLCYPKTVRNPLTIGHELIPLLCMDRWFFLLLYSAICHG